MGSSANKEKAYEKYFANQYDVAIKIFNELIKENPKDEISLNYRGLCHYYLKQYEKAIKDCDKALKLSLKINSERILISRIYDLRGELKYEFKIYEEAIENFNKAIEYDSNNSEPFLKRAKIYVILEKLDEAKKDFDMAISLFEEFKKPSYYFAERARLNIMIKDYKNAIADFKKAIQINPEISSYKNELNKIYRILKNNSKNS